VLLLPVREGAFAWGASVGRDSDDPEVAGAASGDPQCSQNRAEASSTGVPQEGHPCASVAPQPPQKRAPGRTALPHDGQNASAVTAA
jgi:hypothetical protein